MSIYEAAPAADPRALLSAAAFGSIAGVVLGGSYLLAAHLGSTPSTFVTASAPAFVSPVAAISPPVRNPAPVMVQAVQPPRPQLRWLHFAAPPFRPAGVAADKDRECLTQAVYYEARGEAAAGQQAIAQVVLNRVRHPAFPKSVCGVVFQRSDDGCQFSFACDRRLGARRDAAAWSRAQAVADHALDGFVMRQVGEATHFHVSNLAVDWSQGLARVAQIGAHVFYGLTGRPERAFASVHAAPAPEAHTTPPPEAQPVAPAAVDPRVHLILASEPVAPSPPAAPPSARTIVREEPATPVAPLVKPADIVTPPTAIVADTH